MKKKLYYRPYIVNYFLTYFHFKYAIHKQQQQQQQQQQQRQQ